jgi:hypothetical protein
VKFFGSDVWIQKPHRTWRWTGDQPPFTLEPVHSSYGGVSQESGVEVDGRFYDWDRERGPYVTDGVNFAALGDGTIQDTLGNPTSDYTIVLFAADKSFWVPQARRIVTSRPGTDGKFTFRNLPAGEYRLTAVTDVEPGEWYDPSFLGQLVNASIPITVKDGEKKVQDIKVQAAGGGH